MISRQVTRLLSRPNIWHHVSRSATISSSFSPNKGYGKKKKDELTSTSVLSDSYDKMINSLTSDPVIESQLPDQVAYFRNMFNSNVMDGKMNRGNAVVQSFLCIRPSASADDILSAHAVGWSLEVTQAGFLIADDIMDGSITRRGRPCWYKVPSVGLMAVNDVISMQTAAYELVSHFVHNHTMYTKILELLTTCYRFTVLGQSLDTMTSPRPGAKPDFANFTMRKYATITKYKTAYYTISHPVRFGMLLANLTDPLIHSEAEKILLSMGHFFQIQDDYLDCFGDPNVTGKIGRGHRGGKVLLARRHGHAQMHSGSAADAESKLWNR